MLVALCVLLTAGPAAASGGRYTITGGSAREQAEVRHALDATAFDWNLVPAQIAVHIAPGLDTEATVGNVWIDARLLDAGRFSWGIVQHEYAHQVDFFLLDDTDRVFLDGVLGGKDWCYDVTGLAHSQYGCERFASTLAWSYWQSPGNSMKPTSAHDESAAMAPAKFRALLATLIGAPNAVPAKLTAHAPPKRR